MTAPQAFLSPVAENRVPGAGTAPNSRGEAVQPPREGILASTEWARCRTLAQACEMLGICKQHAIDLIIEGKLQALDLRGAGAARACYRIPVEAYRDFVIGSLTLTCRGERIRLLRELPEATLRELLREITDYLRAA